MRRGCATVLGGIVTAVALAAPTGTAQQPQPQRAPGSVNAGVTAVLVDVVVRDRRGQPVTNLTQADFQLVEDGVPQTIGSFTPIFESSAAAPQPPAPAPPVTTEHAEPAAPSGPIVTALVFDRLRPQARKLAVHAAQSYLGGKHETDSYVAIFGVDNALSPYAPFTRDVRVLRRGLDRLATRASSSFNSSEEKQEKIELDQQAEIAGQQAAASVAGAGRGGSGSTAQGDALLAQMASNMIRDFEVMERDQQGYSTTNGLLAVINSMRRLPGRKGLVLFSEGIALPPAVLRLFAGVIDAANRANVSIYTMDAAGLRAESTQAELRDELNRMAGAGGGILSTNRGGALSKDLEKNEDVLRQDPHTGLGQLAQATGGLLFANTNNLGPAFERIETDLRNYYLLGYTSSNDNYDGHFRRIDVKVTRPGVTVAARKGYFAVRDTGGLPINTWEAPALGALDQKPVPNAFPVRAGALLFPERERPGLVPVLVDVKTAPLTFQPTDDAKTYTSDFVVLVRFLDQQNQTARKISQHYEITGPVADIERAKQGEVIFYREPELLPGVYTMQTVVFDQPSGKSSVRFSTVEVPRVDPSKLRMSSVALVKRAEKIPEKDRRSENPLLVDDVVLYPNLGDPVSKTAREVGFYFAVYPGSGALAATLELEQDGKAVAQVPLPLSAADASGRIKQVGRLPLDQLPAGTYDLRVVVKQGSEQVSRSATLRLVP